VMCRGVVATSPRRVIVSDIKFLSLIGKESLRTYDLGRK
jgi:hypothetical protein